MNDAPRKRGRPAGSRKVHPARDRLIHFVVEWVMLQTGLGVGRGVKDPAEPDACIVAAWLLSGGKVCADYLYLNPNREWLIEAARRHAPMFYQQLAELEDQDVLHAQLRTVDHLSVRRAYARIQGKQPWRPAVRDDLRRAERTRRSLGGEVLPARDDSLPD